MTGNQYFGRDWTLATEEFNTAVFVKLKAIIKLAFVNINPVYENLKTRGTYVGLSTSFEYKNAVVLFFTVLGVN